MAARSTGPRGRLLLAALCAVSLAGALAAQALGGFGRATPYEVGRTPYAVAVGNFDGDGRRDLAVANLNSDTVSVLLGKGAGAFGPAREFAVGSRPRALAVGNFNDDTEPDLVVADSGSDTVSVLLGRGDGGFGPATAFPAAAGNPTALAVGNFNRDTSSDLAVAGGAGVSVLLGDGDGGFGPPTSFATGVNPTAVAVGNFNGDARPDLAVANGGALGGDARAAARRAGAHAGSVTGGFGTVSVLLGRGDGGFGPATAFPVGDGTYPTSIAVADFNSDRRPDLALADYFGRADVVSVLLGKGAGAFGAPRNFAVGFSPIALVAGNLNGDSHPDLAVANQDSGDVTVLLGNGAGSFGGRRSYGVGGRGRPSALAIANLNAGGDPDLAVATSASDRVWILLNAGPSPRRLTLSYRRAARRFAGRLSAADPACVRAQRVTVLRRRPGPDRQVGSAVSAANGTYAFAREAGPGTYYARVRAWSACRAQRSAPLTVR